MKIQQIIVFICRQIQTRKSYTINMVKKNDLWSALIRTNVDSAICPLSIAWIAAAQPEMIGFCGYVPKKDRKMYYIM